MKRNPTTKNRIMNRVKRRGRSMMTKMGVMMSRMKA